MKVKLCSNNRNYAYVTDREICSARVVANRARQQRILFAKQMAGADAKNVINSILCNKATLISKAFLNSLNEFLNSFSLLLFNIESYARENWNRFLFWLIYFNECSVVRLKSLESRFDEQTVPHWQHCWPRSDYRRPPSALISIMNIEQCWWKQLVGLFVFQRNRTKRWVWLNVETIFQYALISLELNLKAFKPPLLHFVH